MALVVEDELLSRNRFHLSLATPLHTLAPSSQQPDTKAQASQSESKEEPDQKTYDGAGGVGLTAIASE